MATRKALVLVSGLFQELNSSSDKLDFAGNSTSDLSEGTNQYFTNARSRGAVSVASGNGLTYNSSTGVFGTSAIPNSQLANDDVTIGSTAVALGATASTIAGLTSLASTTLISGVADAANSIKIASGNIVFEGSNANDFETTLTATDTTGSDKTITFPDATGTVALTSDIVYPVTLNNSVTLTNKTLAFGSNTISGTLAQFNTAVTDATLVSTTGSETLTNKSVNLANNTLTGTFAQFNTAVSDATLVSTTGTETLTNKSLTAPTLTGSSSSAGSIIFKEDTDNGTNSATLIGPAATADVTITLPAETGTVLTTASSIANSNLANSTVTIGSSAVALGSSVTTLTGITSITSDAVVAKANGFRVIDNSDTTKQVAFDASGVATSTTRTLTVPNASDTLVLLAESQTLTNKTVAFGSNTVSGTFAQFNTAVSDATLVSTTGSETLTNKTLTSPVLNTGLSGTAFLDEDNMASDSATKVASQQSIKAYVDSQLTAQDLDVEADSGTIAIDLDSETLDIEGGTNITTAATGNKVTINMPTAFATEDFATAIAVALG